MDRIEDDGAHFNGCPPRETDSFAARAAGDPSHLLGGPPRAPVDGGSRIPGSARGRHLGRRGGVEPLGAPVVRGYRDRRVPRVTADTLRPRPEPAEVEPGDMRR